MTTAVTVLPNLQLCSLRNAQVSCKCQFDVEGIPYLKGAFVCLFDIGSVIGPDLPFIITNNAITHMHVQDSIQYIRPVPRMIFEGAGLQKSGLFEPNAPELPTKPHFVVKSRPLGRWGRGEHHTCGAA